MRDPLILPCAAIAAGILVASQTDLTGQDFLLGTGGGLVLAAVALWRGSRRVAGTACCLGLVTAGAWLAETRRPGPPPRLNAENGENLILEGCVVEPPAMALERERFVLELEPGARAQVTLYQREGERLPQLDYGQRVEVEAKTRSPRNFGNPGAFDYARYLARQDVYWTASAPASAVKVLPGRCGNRFAAGVMGLRVAALRRLERLYGTDSYQSGMMQAILIGQTFQLQRVWTEHYRATGTFHALVISGTHVAVLATFLVLLLRLCFVRDATAMAASVAAAWMYALVTGWQAPCVRSAAGMTLFAIGRSLYRERRVLNLLAAVAIGYLVLDPDQLFEPSFQLTFLAVAFIGAFAAPAMAATSRPARKGLRDLDDRDRDPRLEPRAAQVRVELRLLVETVRLCTRLPASAARLLVTVPARVLLFGYDLVLISAVVQMGLALPMVVYFHRVGLTGLSANVLVVPLMELVIPIGFIAIFTGWGWAAHIAGWLLAGSRVVVECHARWEPVWRVPTPPLWLAIGLAAALIAAATLRGRGRWTAMMATAGLLAVLLLHPFPPRVRTGMLELTAIDVGQGDSLLLTFPDGRLMLVDGGGIPAFGPQQTRSHMEIGEDVVAPYLWQRSIRRVDVIAMSHAHDDHIGGLPALLAAFQPRELWTGAAPNSPAWNALRAQAQRAGVKVVLLSEPRRLEFGGAHVDVLAPPPEYVPEETPKNNDSLVLRVAWGRHSFLLCGDAEKQVEYDLADRGKLDHSDVLKIGHHGSRTSTTADLLRAARPAIGLVSVGTANSYGHPHPSIIQRLQQYGVLVLRTDRDGQITVRTDGRRLTLDTWRWSGAGRGVLNVF